MPTRSAARQFCVLFAATALTLSLLLRFDVLERFSYALHRGRIEALRSTLPADDVLAAELRPGAVVARTVGPSVVHIVTEMESSPAAIREELLSSERRPGAEAPPPESDSASRMRRSRMRDEDTQVRRQGLGSGFVIDAERGYILTNAHVVADADHIEVRFFDGRHGSAEVYALDFASDLAVVEVRTRPLIAGRFGDSDAATIGDDVFAVGSPFGLVGTFSKGIVSATHRRNVTIQRESYPDLLQTDAVINPGNSGGPLVNMRGEVIGINLAIATSGYVYDGIGFAIPSNRVVAWLSELGRGFLGVTLSDVRPTRGADEAGGARIDSVVSGSAAARAGLKPGDLVRALDGVFVRDVAALAQRVRAAGAGNDCTLSILRDARPRDVSVTLGHRYEPELGTPEPE